VQPQPYLTVPQVASELGLTPSGVYKLIKRGRLKAIRRTERGLRVSRLALDAYRRAVEGEVDGGSQSEASSGDLRADFERKTGVSPEEWERRWKADELDDSAENMRLTVRALGLRSAERGSTVSTKETVRG
jgi:excisionase family DNA binding protein